jgi:asparagine synthase (glutamine-hydrolysing)
MKNEGAHVVISGAAGDEMLGGYADDYFIPFLRHLLGKAEIALFFKEITCNNEISTTVALRRLIIREFLSIENNQRLVKNRSGESRLLNQVLAPNIRHAKKIIPNLYDEKSFHGITLANMSYRLMNYWLRSGSKSDYGIPIETRAPFLDYRVVEYCCQLPPELLISDGWHKHVLRLAVSDYLPKEVVWRKKKMGFPFPYREWLLASRVVIERNARGLDCPFINTKALFDNYDELVKVAPQTLWRLVSVILWWRRVVEYKEIKAT